MDELYGRYEVMYPFQINCFRTLCEHHWDKNHLFLGETHNFWEATCVLEGEAESVKGNKVYLLQPGNLLFTPPMVFHSSRSSGGECCNLNFTFEVRGTFPSILTDGVFYLTPAELGELKAIYYRLCNAYLQEEADYELGAESANALTSFFIRLSRNHIPSDKISKSRGSKQYQKVVETMQETICDNLSVQEIAERNGISTTTIKELFRCYAGIGPKRYYSDMRGIEARRLLTEGVDIEEITEMLNYSSTSYFSNSFKKQFGMPPGQYRRSFLESGSVEQK